MKIHSPSMSELHAFITTVKLGSLTRAADTLCLTQSAISRAIARLETHLGQQLIKRSPHGIRLTPAGQRLVDAVAGPLQAIEDVSAELRVSTDRNTLSVSVVPTLASVWLMPRLPDFHRQHPEISLTFAAYRRDEDFAAATPHAAILSGVPGQWPGWHSDYLMGREVVVICHPNRLRERRAANRWKHPSELLDEPLLSHTNAPDNWKNWFQAVGVSAQPRPRTSMDQVSIIVRAVMADMGVAVLQRCLIEEELSSGTVVQAFHHAVELPQGYTLVCPASRLAHPALTTFRQWLLQQAVGDTQATAEMRADAAMASADLSPGP